MAKERKIKRFHLEEHTKLQKLEALRTTAGQHRRSPLRIHAYQSHQGVPKSKYDGDTDRSCVCIKAMT